MAFPDGRLTLHAFFHQENRPTEPLPALTGSFELTISDNGQITGRHFCPAAGTGHFDLSGQVFNNSAILNEERTGLRYTGILVVDSLLLKIAFGDYGPQDSPEIRERWVEFAEKTLRIRITGQEQGTWVATKP